MNTEVAIREPQRVQMSADQLRYIGNTEFVPKGLRGNLPAIMACVATGRALGIDDMSSLRLIHVVNGRPTFSAELMVQIVRKRGHSIAGEMGDGTCTVIGKRKDNGDSMKVTWTLAMAKRAGLADKATWKAYPESLLWARAVSQLSRMLFADCFAGSTHTPEEIADGDFDEIDTDLAGEPQAEQATNGIALPTAEAVSQGDSDPASPADAPSAAQLKKLNVLVGTLREAGKVTTAAVWAAAGREPVVSEDGELHWSPLRDSLTKPEASALIERLSSIEEDVLSLTGPALASAVREAGIDPALVGVVGRELFPDAESAGALSDLDRGRVWVALEARLAADEIPFGDPDE